jgi:hypothetical protein
VPLSWDPEDPPAEPPGDCPQPGRWWEAHELFREHRPDEDGWCRTCRAIWPCADNTFAVRGLLEAYAALTSRPPAAPNPQIQDVTLCRWCERGIERHALWGWVHITDALFLCRYAKPGSPPWCSAEPQDHSG